MGVIIKTQEQINRDMLANISDDYEKSIGFLTSDLVKTNSIELAKVYLAIQELINKVNVDNLHGEELARYVLQRKGIKRRQATKSKAMLTITGNTTVNKGDLFSTANNIKFESIETKEIIATGTIEVICTQFGSVGMVGANSITLMPITIAGVTNVTNLSPSYDGFEAENDESLRSRYYETLQIPATSGNIYHYKKWAKNVVGIGDVKVFPLWNGDNTVKILVIDSNMQPASTDLVEQVQVYIDPKGLDNSTWGTGRGQAPIGAYCTIASALGKEINIDVHIIVENGYANEEIISNIENKVSEYLKEIAFKESYVSYAKIGSLILSTEGVADYSNLQLNQTTGNVTVADEEVAILGIVTVS